MGMIKVLFSGAGFAFNKMAKSIKEILDNMRFYKLIGNIEYLYKAAWICKYGVFDSMNKSHWSSGAKIFIPDHPEIGRDSLHVVMAFATTKIYNAIKELPETQSKYVEQILEGGMAYHEVGHLISPKMKRKLKP